MCWCLSQWMRHCFLGRWTCLLVLERYCLMWRCRLESVEKKKFLTTRLNEDHAFVPALFIESQKCGSFLCSLICSLSKISTFCFSVLSTGNFLHMKSKQTASLFRAFTNCFIKPSLMYKGGSYLCQLMLLQLYFFLLPPCFLGEMIIFSPCILRSTIPDIGQAKCIHFVDPRKNILSSDPHRITTGNYGMISSVGPRQVFFGGLLLLFCFSHLSWVTNWN